MKSFEDYSGKHIPSFIKLDLDMEVAQARYVLENQSGTLFLLNFPTPQLAEGYLEDLALPVSDQPGKPTLHAKRSGPLVAFLEGNFDSQSANRILSPIKFSYAVRWVYEKRNQQKIVWGIPARILGTVVNSLFFVTLLCGISIVIGAVVAVVIFIRRRNASKNLPTSQQSSQITQMRLQ